MATQDRPVAWIQGNWIYSHDLSQSGRFWIDRTWIFGPVGSGDASAKYWIDDGHIYGPYGAETLQTGFWIHEGWIWGPSERLPFT